MKVIDQISDRNHQILNALVHDFQEELEHTKTASLAEEDNEKRADAAFAWPEERLFPIDTPEQASLSRLYMTKQASVPKKVIARCEAALDIYGIDLDLSSQTKEASEVKQTENLDDYLLPDHKRYRVTNPEEVKIAAEVFVQNRRVMLPETKATMARRLVKKAEEHHVTLPTTVLRHAGVTVCDTKGLKEAMEVRAHLAADDCQEAYTKLAAAIDSLPAEMQPDYELATFAGRLQEIDKLAGLDREYDRKISNPVETVFNTDKVAQETLPLARRDYPLEVLLAVDPDVYRDAFGEDLADEFIEGDQIDPKALRVILPTVPLDLQQALVAQLGV